MKTKPESTKRFKYVIVLLISIVFITVACTRSYYVHLPMPPLPPDTSLALMSTENLTQNAGNQPIPSDTSRYVVLRLINPGKTDFIKLSMEKPLPPISPDTSHINLIKAGKKNKIDLYYLTNKNLKNYNNIEGKIVNKKNKIIATSNLANKSFSYFEIDSLLFVKASFSFTPDKKYTNGYRILLPNIYNGRPYIISIKSQTIKDK